MARLPSPRMRAKPGSRGGGRFFHIEVLPSSQLVAFRVQDVGKPGGVERVAGQRASGSWDSAKRLVEKSHAHVENGRLVPDSDEAQKLFTSLGSPPVHEGDRFHAEPRRDIPESRKPTPPCVGRSSPASSGHKRPCGNAGSGACDDPQAAIRRIPAVFAQEEPENRQASQSRHVPHAQGSAAARARHPILQTTLTKWET